MNRRKFLLLLAAAMLPLGCEKAKEVRLAGVDYYTCTMHPSVHAAEPGKCPICSMELVPVMKGDAAARVQNAGPTTFLVPAERQQQIGVTYATVERKPLQHSMRAVGVVAPDKARHWEFVARIDGYVQQLFVTSPGEIVEKDQPLMSIYSPDLLTTEREFVDLLARRDQNSSASAHSANDSTERLLTSTRRRLEQWNVLPQQIAALEKSRKPADALTLLSPFRGVVQSVPVGQGGNVKVGDHLVDVTDLSVVWVWADFYQDEVFMLEKGQKVAVTSTSLRGENFEGEVALINPFLDEARRTAKVRIDIPNADFKLRPGMYVDVALGMSMGDALTVAASAVMPTGTRNIVFVDRGEGRLEPRAVEIGMKIADIYEVRSGLAEGERVVASANFLIDAEAKVQGALKAFGEAPAKAHHHDD